jgi:Phage integrase family
MPPPLTANELGALLVAAGLGPPLEHALISLLALNGLRVSEATGADIEHLGLERGHRTLTITRKGGKVVTIPLAPRTARAIDLATGERCEGPIFLTYDGRRLDRHGAGRVVRKVARRAGISKNVGPHTLRHAFITAALDAGVPLRDVQEAASHADPRTTMRYDRARGSLDRHAPTSSPPTSPAPPGNPHRLAAPSGGPTARRTGPRPSDDSDREAVTNRDLNVHANRRSGCLERKVQLICRTLITGSSVWPGTVVSSGEEWQTSQYVRTERPHRLSRNGQYRLRASHRRHLPLLRPCGFWLGVF